MSKLWQEELLFTDLRPPLTIDNPAQYIAERLADIPSASPYWGQLNSLLISAARWDTLPPRERATAYRHLVDESQRIVPLFSGTTQQVDMALNLKGQHLSYEVGAEIARAAELLLRLSPIPHGPNYLAGYRHAFLSKYGKEREISLLELLDPEIGLGPPDLYSNLSSFSVTPISPARKIARNQTLLHLACNALYERQTVVELDAQAIARLETWVPSRESAPLSMDVCVTVAASSKEAVDAGQFRIIFGSNAGVIGAGRTLDRFADLLGDDACEALKSVAKVEESRETDRLWAELIYLPHDVRMGNMLVRPVVRAYEIPFNVPPGVDDSRVIPLDELLVGVRKGRFYVRWPAANSEVAVCSGGLLSHKTYAPPICRFLAALRLENLPQLRWFDWGPAEGYSFLPRVQVGRAILRPAQWRIDLLTCLKELNIDSSESFKESLEHWRAKWQVPRYVHLGAEDYRLLLDLEQEILVEELRRHIQHLQVDSYLILQEVLPEIDQLWVEGTGGHFVTEFVVPLALRDDTTQTGTEEHSLTSSKPNDSRKNVIHPNFFNPTSRLRPPGSEWLFIKLYCGRTLEEEVIAGPMRLFAEKALLTGLSTGWFFLRYSDPEPHLRLRFRGEPERLIDQLFPTLCTWASKLLADGICLRFSFDTYEQEVERYGGPAGIRVSEDLFAADSIAVAELLHLTREGLAEIDRITLAILSIDQLLASLGLKETDRLQWYRERSVPRQEVGSEYRNRKSFLRLLLSDVNNLRKFPSGEQILRVLNIRAAIVARISTLLSALVEGGDINLPLKTIYKSFVHMHCNRLLGRNQGIEQRTLGLLLRTHESLAKFSGYSTGEAE